jgi:hypothetical protein
LFVTEVLLCEKNYTYNPLWPSRAACFSGEFTGRRHNRIIRFAREPKEHPVDGLFGYRFVRAGFGFV